MKELVLDTNIFIRYFIEDIPFQYKESRKIFEDIENGNFGKALDRANNWH